MAVKMVVVLTTDLYDTRQKMVALKDREDKILEQLKPMVDPVFAKKEKGWKIEAGDLILTRSAGKSSRISADSLLERGVSPEIIAYATSITPYFRYLTNPVKKVKDTKEG